MSSLFNYSFLKPIRLTKIPQIHWNRSKWQKPVSGTPLLRPPGWAARWMTGRHCWMLPSLLDVAIPVGCCHPKRKLSRLPTIHFQVRLLLVSGSVLIETSWTFMTKWNTPCWDYNLTGDSNLLLSVCKPCVSSCFSRNSRKSTHI